MATDPICGMWVDERSTSLHLTRENRTYYFCSEGCLHQFAEPALEQRRLLRRLAVVWPLSIAVLVLTYADSAGAGIFAAAALATVVQVYGGVTFYGGTRDAVRDRAWNMDVLIAVGTTTAYLYSLAALALPARLPHEYYFDASALIITLILTGNYLEHLTRARAGSALRRLTSSFPRPLRSYGTASNDRSPWPKWFPGTGSGSARPRGFRPMEWSLPGIAVWTSRCSPASPCPCPKDPATASWPRRSTATVCSK